MYKVILLLLEAFARFSYLNNPTKFFQLFCGTIITTNKRKRSMFPTHFTTRTMHPCEFWGCFGNISKFNRQLIFYAQTGNHDHFKNDCFIGMVTSTSTLRTGCSLTYNLRGGILKPLTRRSPYL